MNSCYLEAGAISTTDIHTWKHTTHMLGHLQLLGCHLKVKFLYISIPSVKWKDPWALWFSSTLFSLCTGTNRSHCSVFRGNISSIGETRLLNVTIKCEQCCWCRSLLSGQESPTDNTRLSRCVHLRCLLVRAHVQRGAPFREESSPLCPVAEGRASPSVECNCLQNCFISQECLIKV